MHPPSQSPSHLSSSLTRKIPKSNCFQERLRLFYRFLGQQESCIYASHFKQVRLNIRTICIIVDLEALIHSKQKISVFHDGSKTQIFFSDPKVIPTHSSLLFPSGRRTRLQQLLAFYSLLESQDLPIYISHFRKIQMNADTTRKLLDIILFVQDQPRIIVNKIGRYMTIQLFPKSSSNMINNIDNSIPLTEVITDEK